MTTTTTKKPAKPGVPDAIRDLRATLARAEALRAALDRVLGVDFRPLLPRFTADMLAYDLKQSSEYIDDLIGLLDGCVPPR